ncbi:MAG: hypothetical protein ACXADY_20795 [Candidatus Hodarchaeales archaeon]
MNMVNMVNNEEKGGVNKNLFDTKKLMRILLVLTVLCIVHELSHIFVGYLVGFKVKGIVFNPLNILNPNEIFLGVDWCATTFTSLDVILVSLAPVLFVSIYLITTKKSYPYWIYAFYGMRLDFFIILGCLFF